MITTCVELWTSVRTAASAQSLVAGPELPAVPFVVRVSETPLTGSVVDAFTTVVPGTSEVRLTVQLPVPPAVVHGLPRERARPGAIEKLICVAVSAPARSRRRRRGSRRRGR